MKRLKTLMASLAILSFVAGRSAPAATTNLIAEADTFTRNGVNAGTAENLDVLGLGGGDRIAYIRFSLSGLPAGNITEATFTLHETYGSRNDFINTGRHEVYGLIDNPGNTPQNWSEAADLNPGAEYDNTSGNDIDTNVVFVLDQDKGASITETVPGSDNVDVSVAGPDLVTFLNQRMAAGGLATFIVAIDSDNRGYGFASREHTTEAPPTLTIQYDSISNSVPANPVTYYRQMENLDRGVVAICNTYPSTTVYVGWRMLGTDPDSVGYNVYRNGSKINGAPITSSCNYVDAGGNPAATYSVAAVIDGVEQERSDPVGTWTSAYLGSGNYIGCQEIPLEPRTGYEPNDACVGDLDGDGDYELVLKRLSQDLTHSSTTFNLIEAYQMDGTLMWTINLGPNNLFAPFEINPIVYDFDGDGCAEVVLRTCEGNIDGIGEQIGDTDGDGITDYRSTAVLNSSYYMIDGPEFISVFDGKTGAEITRAEYIERDPISQWGLPGMSDSQYGHRADKCMLTPAYLDGETPSLVISRGIYHKTVLEAWNFKNGTLTKEWTFNSDSWPGFDGQGNHNLTVGDVDGDGFDEIVYGQMTVDHDGTGLYTTGYGHGDAIHMGAMIPDRGGLQIYGVHESYPYGADLRDAGTGEILWSHTAGGDTGRGCAAHVDASYRGYQMWDVASGGTYDATTKALIDTDVPNWGNFLIWWDADLQREILDGAGSTSPAPIINKWDENTGSAFRLLSLYNYPAQYASRCINGTKSNPCISGDLIGDWREEAIYPSSDNTKLYIYATATVATNRIYTLMHDSMYRTAIAWQCNQYNQPPHPSFYIGAGMSAPPKPKIYMAGENKPVQLSIKTNRLTFATAPYYLYRIESSTNLTNAWQVYTNVVAGGTNTEVVLPTSTEPVMFFRGEQQ